MLPQIGSRPLTAGSSDSSPPVVSPKEVNLEWTDAGKDGVTNEASYTAADKGLPLATPSTSPKSQIAEARESKLRSKTADAKTLAAGLESLTELETGHGSGELNSIIQSLNSPQFSKILNYDLDEQDLEMQAYVRKMKKEMVYNEWQKVKKTWEEDLSYEDELQKDREVEENERKRNRRAIQREKQSWEREKTILQTEKEELEAKKMREQEAWSKEEAKLRKEKTEWDRQREEMAKAREEFQKELANRETEAREWVKKRKDELMMEEWKRAQATWTDNLTTEDGVETARKILKETWQRDQAQLQSERTLWELEKADWEQERELERLRGQRMRLEWEKEKEQSKKARKEERERWEEERKAWESVKRDTEAERDKEKEMEKARERERESWDRGAVEREAFAREKRQWERDRKQREWEKEMWNNESERWEQQKERWEKEVLEFEKREFEERAKVKARQREEQAHVEKLEWMKQDWERERERERELEAVKWEREKGRWLKDHELEVMKQKDAIESERRQLKEQSNKELQEHKKEWETKRQKEVDEALKRSKQQALEEIQKELEKQFEEKFKEKVAEQEILGKEQNDAQERLYEQRLEELRRQFEEKVAEQSQLFQEQTEAQERLFEQRLEDLGREKALFKKDLASSYKAREASHKETVDELKKKVVATRFGLGTSLAVKERDSAQKTQQLEQKAQELEQQRQETNRRMLLGLGEEEAGLRVEIEVQNDELRDGMHDHFVQEMVLVLKSSVSTLQKTMSVENVKLQKTVSVEHVNKQTVVVDTTSATEARKSSGNSNQERTPTKTTPTSPTNTTFNANHLSVNQPSPMLVVHRSPYGKRVESVEDDYDPFAINQSTKVTTKSMNNFKDELDWEAMVQIRVQPPTIHSTLHEIPWVVELAQAEQAISEQRELARTGTILLNDLWIDIIDGASQMAPEEQDWESLAQSENWVKLRELQLVEDEGRAIISIENTTAWEVYTMQFQSSRSMDALKYRILSEEIDFLQSMVNGAEHQVFDKDFVWSDLKMAMSQYTQCGNTLPHLKGLADDWKAILNSINQYSTDTKTPVGRVGFWLNYLMGNIPFEMMTDEQRNREVLETHALTSAEILYAACQEKAMAIWAKENRMWTADRPNMPTFDEWDAKGREMMALLQETYNETVATQETMQQRYTGLLSSVVDGAMTSYPQIQSYFYFVHLESKLYSKCIFRAEAHEWDCIMAAHKQALETLSQCMDTFDMAPRPEEWKAKAKEAWMLQRKLKEVEGEVESMSFMRLAIGKLRRRLPDAIKDDNHLQRVAIQFSKIPLKPKISSRFTLKKQLFLIMGEMHRWVDQQSLRKSEMHERDVHETATMARFLTLDYCNRHFWQGRDLVHYLPPQLKSVDLTQFTAQDRKKIVAIQRSIRRFLRGMRKRRVEMRRTSRISRESARRASAALETL